LINISFLSNLKQSKIIEIEQLLHSIIAIFNIGLRNFVDKIKGDLRSFRSWKHVIRMIYFTESCNFVLSYWY